MTYVPLTYLQDLEALLRELELERFIAFGTSLGGLLTMLLASANRERIAAAVLNDIGPQIDASGLERIKSYVGKSQSWPTWMHAARHFAAAQSSVYPRWKLDDWLAFAHRLCRLTQNGRVVFDYDMRIAEPFRLPGGSTGFDPWLAFNGLKGVPSLALRGELSDLLSDSTLTRMITENPDMRAVTVSGVGHAPLLSEPEAIAAIDALLERVAV